MSSTGHEILGHMKWSDGSANIQKTHFTSSNTLMSPGCERPLCLWTNSQMDLLSMPGIDLTWTFVKPFGWIVFQIMSQLFQYCLLYNSIIITDLPCIPNFPLKFLILVCQSSLFLQEHHLLYYYSFKIWLKCDFSCKTLAWIFLYLFIQMEFKSGITLQKHPIGILIGITLNIL